MITYFIHTFSKYEHMMNPKALSTPIALFGQMGFFSRNYIIIYVQIQEKKKTQVVWTELQELMSNVSTSSGYWTQFFTLKNR